MVFTIGNVKLSCQQMKTIWCFVATIIQQGVYFHQPASTAKKILQPTQTFRLYTQFFLAQHSKERKNHFTGMILKSYTYSHINKNIGNS